MNIVLIIFDSLKRDCFSCYGETPFWREVYTRYLDEFSKEALVMTKVYPESLPTLQVRRAIYTTNRVFPFINADFKLRGDFVGAFGWGPIPETQDTISEILQEKGYRTCLISSVYHQFKPSKNFWENALEGKPVRDHVTCAWSSSITIIDEEWWLNCLINGKGPFLYRIKEDKYLDRNVAEENKEIVDYLYSKAIEDAGGIENIPKYVMDEAERDEVPPGCSPIAARMVR